MIIFKITESHIIFMIFILDFNIKVQQSFIIINHK